jgi:predicted DNA-binding transcriptional regulator AlpA
VSNENQSTVVPLLVSVRDTARLLGISEKTIRNQCCTGTFPLSTVKIGGRQLFRMRDIIALVGGGQHPEVSSTSVKYISKRGRGRPRKVNATVPPQLKIMGAGGEV